MAKRNYLFKLNVQPHILKRYENRMHKLKNIIIPNLIFNSYNNLFKGPVVGKNSLKLTIVQDFNEIASSVDYQELLKITDEIAIEYKNITKEYRMGKGIYYDPQFLVKLDNAMNDRKALLSKYNVLNQANSRFNTSQAYEELERVYNFEIDTEIGKGLDHIRRVRKIILYLDEQIQNGLEEITVDYSYKTEIFKINNVTIDQALASYKKIETQLNDYKDEIGNVKINPIYEKLFLNTSKNMKSIEVLTTYPNGNTDDELEALLVDLPSSTGSKEVRTTFIAPDSQDNSRFLKNINKLARIPSEKGYLSDIRSSGVTIINFNESIIRSELNQDE